MSEKVVGAILAGGRGKRIGGDKPLVSLAGRPLIAHVASILRPSVSGLAVVGSGRAAQAAGAHSLKDESSSAAGPLAGLLSALDWAAAQAADWLVITPCDTPLLPDDIVARLLEGARAADAMQACAATPDGLQPLVSAWRAETAAPLRLAIGGSHPPAHEIMVRFGAAQVRFEDGQAFFNVNEPADLAEAERILRAQDRAPRQ